jgi:hypothetical protein
VLPGCVLVERQLRVSEHQMLKGMFASKKKDLGGTGRKLQMVVCTAHIVWADVDTHTTVVSTCDCSIDGHPAMT